MAVGDTIILPWYGGATAAYSLRFDDIRATVWPTFTALACHDQWTAAEAMASRGLRGSFYAIGTDAWFVGAGITKWSNQQILDAEAAGHEIGNHTWSHSVMSDLPLADQIADIQACQTWLMETVGLAREPRTFVFPGNAYNQETKLNIEQAFTPTWLRGTSSTTGWMTAISVSDGGIEYPLVNLTDNALTRTLVMLTYRWFPIGASSPDPDVTTAEQMATHAQKAIDAGGWAQAQIHDVPDEFSGHNGATASHLDDFVLPAIAAGDLWVAPVRDVANYYHQRVSTTITKLAMGRRLIRLLPSSPIPFVEQPLTVRTVVPSEWASSGYVLVQQVGRDDQTVEIDGDSIQYDLHPTSGEVVLRPVCSPEDAAALVSGEATAINGTYWTMDTQTGTRPSRIYTASGKRITVPASDAAHDWQLLRDQ